jgi:hypothetical protein
MQPRSCHHDKGADGCGWLRVVAACMSPYGGDEGSGAFFPGGVPARASGRKWLATGQLAMAWAKAGPDGCGEGELTVGAVWQSAYPPDERFSDARVHHRFSPRHRKPSRLARIARAAAPVFGRLRSRVLSPEMQPDNV